MNVAPGLISLSPPAFQSILFRPAPKPSPSLLSPESQPQAIEPKISSLSPLCFHGLTNCFSRKPFILRNICVAPRVCPQNLFSEAQLRRLADHTRLSPSLSTNCTLLFSLPALFRTPALYFQQLADSLCKNRGVGVSSASRTSAQLSLCALCVLCGASAFPALSFPSFGGPKNADAR